MLLALYSILRVPIGSKMLLSLSLAVTATLTLLPPFHSLIYLLISPAPISLLSGYSPIQSLSSARLEESCISKFLSLTLLPPVAAWIFLHLTFWCQTVPLLISMRVLTVSLCLIHQESPVSLHAHLKLWSLGIISRSAFASPSLIPTRWLLLSSILWVGSTGSKPVRSSFEPETGRLRLVSVTHLLTTRGCLMPLPWPLTLAPASSLLWGASGLLNSSLRAPLRTGWSEPLNRHHPNFDQFARPLTQSIQSHSWFLIAVPASSLWSWKVPAWFSSHAF